MRRAAICLAASLSPFMLQAQAPPRPDGVAVIVRPARVFDGATLQEGWAVRIRGERIEAAGPAAKIAADGATPICCYRRRKLLDRAEARELVESELRRTSEATGFAVIAYCLMPDHLHVVCEALSDESDLQAFVQLFKQRAAYAWKQEAGEALWQASYYDHVLRESESTRSVVRYTLENPVRARLVDEPGQYAHIGSFVYGRDELMEWAFGWNRVDR